MAINPYVDFMVEDPYRKAQREAEQRAMLAQILEQQAFQPFEQRPAPISRTEGFAKLLAAGLAGLSRREQREAEQRARDADLESAVSELTRISRPTEKVESEELMRMPGADVERLKTLPGQFDISAVAPEIEFSDKGEVTGFKPMELKTEMQPAGPGIPGFDVETGEPRQFVDEATGLSDMGFYIPEMSKEQKRAAYIRMLGGGPISQAFGQQGITDLMKTPQYADIAAPSAKDFTPASLAEYRKSGDPSVLVRAEAPESKVSIGTPGFENFTTESLAKYQVSGDPRDLIAKPKAPKEVDQGSVDARRFRQEDTLRTNFEKRVAPYEKQREATANILEIELLRKPGEKLDQTTQSAYIILLNKFLDPNSVVREAEFERSIDQMGLFRKAAMLKDRLMRGDILDETAIQDIVKLARKYDEVALKKINSIARETATLAEKRGLDVGSVVMTPAYLAEPTSYPSYGPSTRGRPRIPGAGTGSAPQVDVGGANAIIMR